MSIEDKVKNSNDIFLCVLASSEMKRLKRCHPVKKIHRPIVNRAYRVILWFDFDCERQSADDTTKFIW